MATLGPEWKEYVDQSGKKFYYNGVTKESQREKPEGIPREPEEAKEKASASHGEAAAEAPEAPEAAAAPEEASLEEQRATVATALQAPDALLLQETHGLLLRYMMELQGDPNEGVQFLVDHFEGRPTQMVLAGACADLATRLTAGEDERSGQAWEETVLKLLEDMILRNFNPDVADEIAENRKVPAWLREMLSSRRWRRLLLRLYRKHPNSTLLIFCLNRMSSQGLQREIAQTIGVADNFDICRDVFERIFERVPLAQPYQLEALARDLRGLAASDAFHALLGHQMLQSLTVALRARAAELAEPAVGAPASRKRARSPEGTEGGESGDRSGENGGMDTDGTSKGDGHGHGDGGGGDPGPAKRMRMEDEKEEAEEATGATSPDADPPGATSPDADPPGVAAPKEEASMAAAAAGAVPAVAPPDASATEASPSGAASPTTPPPELTAPLPPEPTSPRSPAPEAEAAGAGSEDGSPRKAPGPVSPVSSSGGTPDPPRDATSPQPDAASAGLIGINAETAACLWDAAGKLERIWSDAVHGMNGNGRSNWLLGAALKGGLGDTHRFDRDEGDHDRGGDDDDASDRMHPLVTALCSLLGLGGLQSRLAPSDRMNQPAHRFSGAMQSRSETEAKQALGKLAGRTEVGNGWGASYTVRGPFLLHLCARHPALSEGVFFLLDAILRQGSFYPKQDTALRDTLADAGATDRAPDGPFALLVRRVLGQPHALTVLLEAAFHSRKRVTETGPVIEILAKVACSEVAGAEVHDREAQEVAILQEASDVCADTAEIDMQMRSGALVHRLFAAGKASPMAVAGMGVWIMSMIDAGPIGWVPEQMLPILLPEMVILECKFADLFPKCAPLALAVVVRALFLEFDPSRPGGSTGSVMRSGLKLRTEAQKTCVDAMIHLSVSHGLALECISVFQHACAHDKADRTNLRTFIVGLGRAVEGPLSVDMASALGNLLIAGAAQAIGVSLAAEPVRSEGGGPAWSAMPGGAPRSHGPLPQGVTDALSMFQAAAATLKEHVGQRGELASAGPDDAEEEDWDMHEVKAKGAKLQKAHVPPHVLEAVERTVQALLE